MLEEKWLLEKKKNPFIHKLLRKLRRGQKKLLWIF